MRLAWFTPAASARGNLEPAPTDDTALLIRALAPRHEIDVIDARGAHEFVWRYARSPYDLCVYELDNTPSHQFVWPYLLHYSGVTLLRSIAVPNLVAAGRGPRTSFALHASRIAVVAHDPVADVLRSDFPSAPVRAITPGVEPLEDSSPAIVESLRWPVDGAPLTDALAGFAAARPVIVFDCTETADWPSLDPQNWQPRSPEPPMCVAIDPRDEDHSRRLALRRLQRDGELRERLGAAAHAWWRAHATVAIAANAFEQVLEEARALDAPERPGEWPAFVSDDGTRRARELLAPFGITDLGF